MKKLLVSLLVMTMVFTLFGCMTPKTDVATGYNNASTMQVDKANKVITMQCEVNGTYFTQPTRHGVVFKDGSNGEKSVLRGLHSEKEFYNAMMELGFKPGNNLTADTMAKGGVIEGDKVRVTVQWAGQKEIPFQNIIRAETKDNKDYPYTMDIRFGGNIDRANAKNTGCVLCLDSCAVGIVSDATWPGGAVEVRHDVGFYGRKEVLPPDGTRVTVKFYVG